METIKEFHFDFKDLKVSVPEVAGLMGYSFDIPEPFPGIIDKSLDEALTLVSIRGGYRLFNHIETDHDDYAVVVENKRFHPGRIILKQMKKATSAALFICTAGEGISHRSKTLMSKGEMMEGYILDLIGSVTVEKAMDIIQSNLKKEMEFLGLGISNRYSPGYCNWDVADQQKLFSLFPEGFCGVTLSESSLMNPIKSVSGIIGIGPDLVEKGYHCQWCNDQTCIYRRIRQKMSH